MSTAARLWAGRYHGPFAQSWLWTPWRWRYGVTARRTSPSASAVTKNNSGASTRLAIPLAKPTELLGNQHWSEPRLAGKSYDNALAESVNGLYKAEVIHRRSWKGHDDVEMATLDWVDWYNTTRLHSALGMVPPCDYERAYHTTHTQAKSA